MPGDPFADLIPGSKAAPRRAPSAVANRRLDMASTGENIESANVNQAQGRTSLAVDTVVVPDDILKRQSDARKAKVDADVAEMQAPQPGDKASLVPGASETKTRLTLSLGPSILAQQRMLGEERWDGGKRGRNPFLSSPGAIFAKVTERVPFTALAGGEEFQRYQQAAKSWESAILPIFSGANVTPSEAMRQIKARLPAVDDNAETIRTKSIERMMMTNASADMLAKPRPFPKYGALYPTADGVTTKPPPGVSPVAAPAAKPTRAQFLVAAKRANPGVSEAELNAYYTRKYGGSP